MTELQAASNLPVRWRDFVVVGFFSLLPGMAVGGVLGLPVLVGLAAALGYNHQRTLQTIEKTPIFLVVLFVATGWAAVSSLWSPWDGQANVKIIALVVFGLLLGCWMTAPPQSRWTLAGASAALMVLIALTAIEALSDSALNRAADPTAGEFTWTQNPARGAVVMLVLLWPALAWMLGAKTAWRWPVIIWFVAGASFVALQFGQHSNLVGLCIGAVFFAFGFAAPRLAILLPAFGLAVWLAIAPFATLAVIGSAQAPAWLPHSWDVRLGIWKYTSERILERPWFGHGLDAARATTERTVYDGEAFRVIPVHPHSASLQVWYDTGVIGVALAIALVLLIGLRLSRLYANARLPAAATAAIVAMLGTMANVGWSLWQEWWMATIILAGILLVALGAEHTRRIA